MEGENFFCGFLSLKEKKKFLFFHLGLQDFSLKPDQEEFLPSRI